MPTRSHQGFIFPRAGRASFKRANITDVSSHNLRKTFATRLLSRGAAITDVQHLLGHASVITTEKAYAAFVKNERFKQTIDLVGSKYSYGHAHLRT
ncbi:MAG: tyrosine-type recombinase/integrase, partial [Thiogranum sp.]